MATPWPLDELTASYQALRAGAARPADVAAGEAVITAGERPDALFLVEEGTVRIELRGHEIATRGPGTLVGEMSLASGDAASADVVAVTAVRVARASGADLGACAERDPGFSARLYRGIARLICERLQRRNLALFDDDTLFADLPQFAAGLEALRAAALPPVVVDAIERYERVGDPRRAFLYRWAWHGLEETVLSVVAPEWREHVKVTKLLAVIANVLFDDLADVPGHELEFQAAIDRMLGVDAPPNGADIDGPYFELLFALWREIHDRARELPGWERHRLLLRFDYEQVFAAMRYVVLTRRHPGLDNLAEHRAYLPHSINIMVFATLDLMAAAPAGEAEIGLVREAAWHAQCVTQISNMAVTWRREVPDRDFSSRVFPLALDAGVLTRDELATLAPEEIVTRIEASGVEQLLLDELRGHRRRVTEIAARASEIDLRHYARGMEQVLAMGQAARGLI
jgi:hypothetical protein